VKLTRRELVARAAGSALAAGGIYELVERLGAAPQRAAAATIPHLPEQHVLQALRVVVDDGVKVFEPPLHHQVVTATLRVDETPAALAEARAELEQRLRKLDDAYPSTPAGLGVTVGWGLPYFDRYVPGQARKRLPVDRRASAARGRTVRVLEAAKAFPSDPDALILERNDVAVLLRSDSLERVREASHSLFGDANGPFRVTSIRRGFVGGGFSGGQSLPKKMALAARVPGADLIPDRAELFLGFTSTQAQQPGRERISNLETLGYADLGDGYFAHGTHMHLSHLFEDLEAWYLNFTHQQRVDTMFRPGLKVPPSRLSVAQGPKDVQTAHEVAGDYHRANTIGHSGSIQPASRLDRRVTGPDGVVYEPGTPIPHRADFNTLDNPFFWSASPARDSYDSSAKAGLHFVVFNPTSDDFRRGRLAMDGVMPNGKTLKFPQGSRGQGFNSVLTTTHRQNFLVPPRAHRSFPLSELRS
jgi:hypothetical protein